MELIAWAIQVQLYKYRTFRIAPQEKVSSQCLTLGSRKLNYKRAHYTTLLMKLHEKLDSSVTRWNDIIIDIFNDNVHI
ncbi:hypothetical protein [Wolbachia endosymbiont (group A) of Bibio marci]|uniref:hypothetical protein n=1 Tax=Wolbachia endosymbiont (group A) of Bibio marci TaxID=2953987 RepID=UPI00222F0E4F|nr:hypothetical protein [Wolbachia endosymbiont (group A) of Bibio marci]